MIRVSLALDRRGLVRKMRLSGHAGFALKGQDIVCASVTALVRTFVRALESNASFRISGKHDERGFFEAAIAAVPQGQAAWFKGLCDGLTTGLVDLAEEFGPHIDLIFEDISEEEQNGT